MLTKIDLKEITNIVQRETTKIVKAEVSASEKRLDKKINTLDKKINKIGKKQDLVINFLDRDYLRLLHRAEAIEEHLHLEPATL